MIVYKNKQYTKGTAACLAEIETVLRRLAGGGTIRHEDAVDLLTGFGDFETAAADALSGDRRYRQAYPLLRRIGNLTGHIFCASWENSSHTRLWVHFLQKDFSRLAELPLPPALIFRVPEGCVYRNLYPETYLEAARKFFREVGPEQVLCIGLRSSGTSLSSVVSAMLESLGCKVSSFTVRPQGDPFHRRVEFGWELGDCLRDLNDPFFVLVDEGPGMSGSSLCGTAQGLSEIGVPDDRIVFMPGPHTDGSGFVSEAARARWRKHRIFTADFEEVWLRNRRLTAGLPEGQLTDVSGEQGRTFFSGTNGKVPSR